MIENNAPTRHITQVARHERDLQAEVCEQLRLNRVSQASVARQYDIPRTTVSSWMVRQAGVDAEREVTAFICSPAGLAFLHRLVTAAHFVFGLVGLGSSRLITLFLDLSGLAAFVAASKTVCNERHKRLVELTCSFAHQQQQRLAPLMKADLGDDERSITLCCDETFHPNICLVAIEPVSNFIVLEHYAPNRKASTWILDARLALKHLPVKVVQVAADGAEAIAALADHLGAHLTPDLMHIVQPLTRKVLAAAGRKVEAAKKGGEEPRLVEVQEKELEQLRGAMDELNEAYHPLDLNTGEWMATKTATQRLEQAFGEIEKLIQQLELSDKSIEGLGKSRKHLEQMIRTLGRAEMERKALLRAVPDELKGEVDVRARVAYLEKMARGVVADTRKQLLATAEQIRGKPAETDEVQGPWKEWVSRCLAIFERSSSCVEGRNGYLALCHHARHRLSDSHLQALTCVHNYFIRRTDGTCPAQRFFGHQPHDLFEFLLEQMPYPAWPSARKRFS